MYFQPPTTTDGTQSEGNHSTEKSGTKPDDGDEVVHKI